MTTLAPLETIYEGGQGRALPLPLELAALYGPLRVPTHPGRPHVMGNFVTTLDGVVSLNMPGRAGGGEISGFNPHDRMVMGPLRAVTDAVIVGAGTLRAATQHRWTAAYVYPALAGAYRTLRAALGKPGPPLTVIVSAFGRLDLDLPVFQAADAPVLIVTTTCGAQVLRAQRLPRGVDIADVYDADSSWLSAAAILDAARHGCPGDTLLVEGGPRLLGTFLAEQRLDELFLTLAPQVAGRDTTLDRPGLVAGQLLAPDRPRWGALVDVKRAGSHLLLRYAFEPAV